MNRRRFLQQPLAFGVLGIACRHRWRFVSTRCIASGEAACSITS